MGVVASAVRQAQDRPQPALSFEGMQLVAIPDMPAVHEKLRQRRPAAPRPDVYATSGVPIEADFPVDHAVAIQQGARPRAVSAP